MHLQNIVIGIEWKPLKIYQFKDLFINVEAMRFIKTFNQMS